MNWVRVNRKHPCSVCLKPDWCSVSDDGTVAVCMRMESDKPCKSGGWFHELAEKPAQPRRPAPRPVVKPVPTADFAALACKFVDALPSIEIPAMQLGLTTWTLERLQMGYMGTAYTFPMRDAAEKVIGIRVRASDGRKWCVPGSHNGLFWPDGVDPKTCAMLLLPEGPTSCGACLDLGYAAIGRPNCEARIDLISEVVKRCRGDVVIIADHDEAKTLPDGSVRYPGQAGAQKIAQAIKSLCRTLRVVKMPFHKDPRDFLRSGGTHAVFSCLIKATKYI